MIILLFFTLIVFCVNFKIALGMVAGRADLRRFLTDHNVTAVAALPHLDLALGEDLRHLHIVQQGTVALLVVLFNGGDQAETLRQLMETFLIGSFGKAVVHIRPLVVLALSGGTGYRSYLFYIFDNKLIASSAFTYYIFLYMFFC